MMQLVEDEKTLEGFVANDKLFIERGGVSRSFIRND